MQEKRVEIDSRTLVPTSPSLSRTCGLRYMFYRCRTTYAVQAPTYLALKRLAMLDSPALNQAIQQQV
jgi:hypothetical protein